MLGISIWLPTLRQPGHTGITLTVYLADGALFTALEHKCRARHLPHYRNGQDLGDSAWYLGNADLGVLHQVQEPWLLEWLPFGD